MIETSEISVVVQGAIAGKSKDPVEQQITRKVLRSIRKYLPKAEIILSTWKGSDIKGLDFDILVESDDPGATLLGEHKGIKTFNNINRQIVSSKAGLERAKRKYAVKTRTDILFVGRGFLRAWESYKRRNERFRFFEERVVVGTIYSPNPERWSKKPFHPSDWFAFGLTEDVRNLWGIPLAPEPETSFWFKTHPVPAGNQDNDTMRYRPEQYVWLSFLRKYVNVPCEHQWDYGEHNRELHELALANNLILLHPREIGIQFTKYRFGILNWISFYHHLEWLELYKKYCDPEFPLPINWRTSIQNTLSRWIEKSPKLRYWLQWYDYRYVRLTQAWNSPDRWRKISNLVFRT